MTDTDHLELARDACLEWWEETTDLRKENAILLRQLDAARAEAEELRALVAELKATITPAEEPTQ